MAEKLPPRKGRGMPAPPLQELPKPLCTLTPKKKGPNLAEANPQTVKLQGSGISKSPVAERMIEPSKPDEPRSELGNSPNNSLERHRSRSREGTRSGSTLPNLAGN